MKKLFSLIISFSLAFVTLFSFSTSNIVVANAEKKPILNKDINFVGQHRLDADFVESDDYIVKGGDFRYTVVVSSNQTKKDIDALAEFKVLLKRAIGKVPVTVMFDSDITTFNPEQPYISIGYTKLLELAEAANDEVLYDSMEEVEAELNKNGVRIKTIGKAIFIVGGTDNGILNAVYRFFNLAFHYEQYTKNCLEIDKNVKDLKLIDFDVLDLPDVEYCSGTYGPTATYTTASEADYKALLDGDLTRDDVATEIKLAASRLKFYLGANHNVVNLASGLNIGKNTNSTSSNHSTMLVVSPTHEGLARNEADKIKVDRSTWYASSLQQICYTAHGEAEEMQKMQKYVANYFITKMESNDTEEYPNADFYPFGNMDGVLYCKCDACKAAQEKYNGAYSGPTVEFVNGVCELIEEQLDEWRNDADPTNDKYIRDDFKILIFVYKYTNQPPAEFNEDTGEWEMLNGLEVNEHISPMITDFPEPRYTLYDERTISRVEGIEGWCNIANNLYAYNYGENYQTKGVYLDTLNGFAIEKAQYIASKGFIWNFTEIQSGREVVSTWHNLQYYMIGQQCWNSNYNAEELIDKFFNAYYGFAAETMKALYYNQRIHSVHMTEQHEVLAVGYNTWSASDYPFETIKGWLSQIDFALNQIEPYKNIDQDLYDTYSDRIIVESLQYIWLIYEYYRQTKPYTFEERQSYIEKASSIANRFNNAYFTKTKLNDWAKT